MDHSTQKRRLKGQLYRRPCLWLSLMLCILGFGTAGADQPSLTFTIAEGKDVTLSDGSEPSASNVVNWLFKKDMIARKWNERIEYSEKVEKLDLDVHTGCLTIYNVSVSDSGDYQRMDYSQISKGTYHLNVTGYQVAGVYPAVGANVTLHTGHSEVPECSIIIWNFTTEFSQRIAESICLYEKSDIKYSGNANLRLTVNPRNASLTITDLRTTDSGMYSNEVLSNTQIRLFHLRVFAPVSQPTIIKLGTSCSCSVLCTVKNVKEVILSWYRGNERLSNISSPDLQTNLTLPLNITAQDVSTYLCVASNPVGNLTTRFNRDALCPGPSNTGVIVGSVFGLFGALCICVICVILWRCNFSLTFPRVI